MGTESEINFFFSICPDFCCLLSDDGTLLQVNKVWEEKFLYPTEYFEGKKFTDFMTPEDAQVVMDRYIQRISGGPSNGSICKHFDKDGKMFWVEWRASFSPVFHKMYAIGRDVTEQLNLSQDLKKAVDTKNKLFSVISHDLKSQLAGLIQMTGMMSDAAYDFSKEELIQYSALLHTSSKNLHELLENLLNWSKIQRCIMKVEKTEFDLIASMQKTLAPFKAQADSKKIDFQIQVPQILHMTGDEQMVSSILRNLVSNAIKFTPASGHIIVSASKTSDGIHFEVSDSGIGIPDDMRPNLFKYGENISRKGTEGEPSCGLGLIITEEFVHLNHGSIVFTSAVNKGTTFEVDLPQ
jgi:PAS domain S-box-containing protein